MRRLSQTVAAATGATGISALGFGWYCFFLRPINFVLYFVGKLLLDKKIIFKFKLSWRVKTMDNYNHYVDNPPKVFISYSWSSEDHKGKVLNLAKRLKFDGVDVVLDRWHLKEGQSIYDFMELSVKSPEISKVLIICDKQYADKADIRKGGVGTETQIITPKLYEDSKQTKFIPIIFERDENGKEILPVYLNGRLYFDLSDSEKYESEYTRLLRDIFQRPEEGEPSLGSPPSYLFVEKKDEMTKTLSKFNQFKNAISTDNKNSIGIYQTYLESFIYILQTEFHIDETGNNEIDDLIIESINTFIPYRDEFIGLINIINKYKLEESYIDGLYTFFEKILNLFDEKNDNVIKSPIQNENYKFICWELFLYAIALFIQNRNLPAYKKFTENRYFVENKYGENMVSFMEMRPYLRTLDEYRKNRLKLNLRSVAVTELFQRCKKGISFNLIMQADLLLYLSSKSRSKDYHTWFPLSIIYANHDGCKFELFLRAENESDMNILMQFLNVSTKEDLKQIIENDNLFSDRYFSMHYSSIQMLTNFHRLFKNL
jgi:hypothetical protein